MGRIMRIGFVEYGVSDIERAKEFYESVLGLIKTGESFDRVYYKCWDEYDHHSIVLNAAQRSGLVKIGWKVEQASDLEYLEKRLADYGIVSTRVPKGTEPEVGESVCFVAPSGQTMWLFHEMTQLGRAVTPPEILPNDLVGIAPLHLDHLVLAADDLDEAVRFYTTVLGFHTSEQVLNPDGHCAFSFLFLGSKPHDLALTKGPRGKFHHLAFYVEDWEAVKRAHKLLTDSHCRIAVPPSRHGITRGSTTYFYDPAGNRLETFSGGYLTYPDFPTVTWTSNDLEKALFNSGGPDDPHQFRQWL